MQKQNLYLPLRARSVFRFYFYRTRFSLFLVAVDVLSRWERLRRRRSAYLFICTHSSHSTDRAMFVFVQYNSSAISAIISALNRTPNHPADQPTNQPNQQQLHGNILHLLMKKKRRALVGWGWVIIADAMYIFLRMYMPAFPADSPFRLDWMVISSDYITQTICYRFCTSPKKYWNVYVSQRLLFFKCP